MKKKVTIENLAEMVSAGFESVDKRFDEVEGAHRTDTVELRGDISSIRRELGDFKDESTRRFNHIDNQLSLVVENVLDHGERIETIEKAIGLRPAGKVSHI